MRQKKSLEKWGRDRYERCLSVFSSNSQSEALQVVEMLRAKDDLKLED